MLISYLDSIRVHACRCARLHRSALAYLYVCESVLTCMLACFCVFVYACLWRTILQAATYTQKYCNNSYSLIDFVLLSKALARDCHSTVDGAKFSNCWISF